PARGCPPPSRTCSLALLPCHPQPFRRVVEPYRCGVELVRIVRSAGPREHRLMLLVLWIGDRCQEFLEAPDAAAVLWRAPSRAAGAPRILRTRHSRRPAFERHTMDPVVTEVVHVARGHARLAEVRRHR